MAVVPTWKMVTMCGCPDSLPIATCSRTNRSRLSGSRSAVSTFTATVRSSARWPQRYTTPNPPRPISSGSSKPAATSSAGIPACTSRCVGSGSLLAIARLDTPAASMTALWPAQPEHNPDPPHCRRADDVERRAAQLWSDPSAPRTDLERLRMALFTFEARPAPPHPPAQTSPPRTDLRIPHQTRREPLTDGPGRVSLLGSMCAWVEDASQRPSYTCMR